MRLDPSPRQALSEADLAALTDYFALLGEMAESAESGSDVVIHYDHE